MAAAVQSVSVRVGVEGTEEGTRKLVVFGDSADKVFKKIKTATEPATKSLALVNVAGEQLKFGMESLAEGSGTLGTSLMRLGPWGLGGLGGPRHWLRLPPRARRRQRRQRRRRKPR